MLQSHSLTITHKKDLRVIIRDFDLVISPGGSLPHRIRARIRRRTASCRSLKKSSEWNRRILRKPNGRFADKTGSRIYTETGLISINSVRKERRMRYTILIAEDDQDIVDMLALYMDHEFEIIRASDGEAALKALHENRVDLALVDIMMPKMDGYEFIREARKEYNLPVIILSAKGEDTDKVFGLNIGADAYLTKPFNPFEVIAYIKASLRRFYQLGSETESVKEPKLLKVGDLTLNPETFVVRKNGTVITLTPSEFKILAKLMRAPGRVFTKAQLYECINGD